MFENKATTLSSTTSVSGMRPASHRALVNRLQSYIPLSDDDRLLIQTTIPRSKEVPSGVRVQVENGPHRSLVVSGWIGRVRILADGRRQIISTVLPGELLGSYPNPLVTMSTISLTGARVADLSSLVDALARAPERHGNLRRAMSIAMLLEEALMTEQVMRLGHRTAFERVGHWLLDVQSRLNAAGLSEDATFPMPLTQETVGDVLGLSLVHINRVLQQLRREKLVEVRGGRATILDAERLRMIAEYVPIC